MGIPDIFIEHGERQILMSKYGLNAFGIVSAVKELLSGK
jgi:deoxyxylulose-5-phosphate synthase